MKASDEGAARAQWLRLLRMTSWIILASLTTASTWIAVFTNFQRYDDEGYLLMVVRKILSGGRPYEDVYVQYGPFFVLWKTLAHRWLGAPLNHDAARVETVVLVSVTLGLVAWVVYKLTRSNTAAFVALLVCHSHALALGTGEPGHPQFITLLLTVLAFGLIATAQLKAIVWRSAGIGALVACIALTKVNAGAYVVLAFIMWLLLPWAADRLGRLALIGASGIVLQGILMHGHERLWPNGGREFWLAWALGLLGVILACGGARSATKRLSLFGLIAGGVTVVAVMMFAMASQGVHLSTLFDGILMRPMRAVNRWFILQKFPQERIFLFVPGAMLAVALAANRRRDGEHGSGWLLLVRSSQCVFGAFIVWTALNHNFDMPFAMGPVGLWLLAISVREGAESSSTSQTRRLLAIGIAWQVLYAYPVAGMQMAYVAVLLAMSGVLCGYYGVIGLADILRQRWPGILQARRAFVAIVTALVLAYGASDALRWRMIYQALTPLGLPGAQWVRLSFPACVQLRAVTSLVRQSSCESLISFPGMYSFNFWAAKDSPTNLNVTAWMALSPQEQRRLIADVERAGPVCVLTNARIDRIWLRENVRQDPIGRWLNERPLREIGGVSSYRLHATSLENSGAMSPR